ncbi:MAG: alginate export family protein [Nitrosomonas sp.]|nr:alginate export family protein [Nitrosomonas sp.]
MEGGEDNPICLRNRAWIGIKDSLDPFRFAVEFQDSRAYNNKHAITDQERNEYNLLNAYGELYFKKHLGSMIGVMTVRSASAQAAWNMKQQTGVFRV